MTLPIDLVLVRHGQSEGNLAKRLSEAGDHSAFDRAFRKRHTRSFRLTNLGRSQATRTGDWLRRELGPQYFDRYYTSEYARAIETALELSLPNADWFTEPDLNERDWGDLDKYNEEERMERFAQDLEMRDVEPFLWRPQNGENFLWLRFRVNRGPILTLHNECSDKRVIIVCHGEVMWAFRVILERMPQLEFKRLHLSKRHEDRIHNCQVLHYTRRDPQTGKLHKYMGWLRMVRPTDTPATDFGWKPIVRPRYTNADLRAIVEQYPAVLE